MSKDPLIEPSPAPGKKPVETTRDKGQRAPLSWPWALGLLALLLLLPVWAAVDLSHRIDWRFIVSYLTLISGLTYAFYWSDKRRAKSDQWRIPESQLHLLELLGGWAAALAAQRWLRHKTKKKKFLLVFWLIIALHQLASFEIVSKGLLFRSLFGLISGN